MDSHLLDQQVVLEALFKDLSTERTTGKTFDAIFFTGDLVGKGKYSKNTQEIVSTKFLEPLLTSAGVQNDRFFLVPGNHDFNQEKLPPFLRPSFDQIKSNESANQLIDQLSTMPYLWAGFEDFNALRETFVRAPRIISNALFESYKISVGTKKIGICAINSSWRATGKPDDHDYGKLVIGQRQLDLLTQSISDCDAKLALVHHPISWLVQFDQSMAYRHLYNHFDGVFFGHNHMADLSSTARPSGRTFLSNAGCLYQGRSYFNGYSITTVDLDSFEWEVRVREYYQERESFSASERFAPGGFASFSLKNTALPSSELYLPTEEFLTSVADAINSQLLSSTVSDIAPKNIKQLFVMPPLCSISEKKISTSDTKNKPHEFFQYSHLINERSPILFVGPKESGKTTLLNFICAEVNEIPDINGTTIGCYVNLHLLTRLTRSALIEAMVAFSGGSYLKGHFLDMLKLGRLAVCLDNLDPLQDKQVSLIRDFINEFPNNKYYISTKESAQASLNEASLPKTSDNQKTVYIHSFSRQQTRELMQRWFHNSEDISSDQVDSILGSLKRLNIPRTPFLISVFLWVHEKRIAFDPVNHVEIIDTLVDGMLDKFQETKSRSRLDSTAKRHFLTDLAFHLHRSNRDRLTHNELDLFTAEYFKKKLLTAASGPFIDELTQKGIFIDLGEEVSFKFDCLRAFFLSIRLQESSEFFNEALTRAEFLKLGEELDYFTGKQRGREDALRRALELLDDFFAPVALDLDLSLFDEITFTDFPISLKDRQELGKELFPAPPTAEQRERILDSIDAKERAHDNEIKVRKTRPSAVPDFVSALQITSTILRNSELIDNASLKREAYQKIIGYWAQLMLVVLLVVELRDEAEELRGLKDLEKAMAESGMDFGFVMKLLAPRAVFGLILESLGTSQLEVLVNEHAESAKHCVEQLTSTVLQIDLSLNGYLTAAERFVDKFNKHRFALSLLSMKLMEMYTLKSLPEAHVTGIQKLLSEIHVLASSPASLPQRNFQKMQFLAAIKRRRNESLKGADLK